MGTWGARIRIDDDSIRFDIHGMEVLGSTGIWQSHLSNLEVSRIKTTVSFHIQYSLSAYAASDGGGLILLVGIRAGPSTLAS